MDERGEENQNGHVGIRHNCRRTVGVLSRNKIKLLVIITNLIKQNLPALKKFNKQGIDTIIRCNGITEGSGKFSRDDLVGGSGILDFHLDSDLGEPEPSQKRRNTERTIPMSLLVIHYQEMAKDLNHWAVIAHVSESHGLPYATGNALKSCMDEISNANAWRSMSEATVSKSNTRYAEAGNKDLLVKTKVIESRLEVLNFLQEVSSENLWRIFVDGVTSRCRGSSVAADVEGLARAGEIQQLIVQWLELARPMRDRARAGEAKVQRIRDLQLDRSEHNKVTAAKLLLLELKGLIEQLENDKEPGLVLLTTGVVSDKLALEFKDVTPSAPAFTCSVDIVPSEPYILCNCKLAKPEL